VSEENKLYVGNIPWSATEDTLAELFTEAGDVVDVKIITDRETGRNRGFGFVRMASRDGVQKAISRFNNYELDRRPLTVNEARPRT